MKRIFLVPLSLALLSGVCLADELARNFATPPENTRPRCYWYWMDGQMTKEGITADLEAMKRVGIGEPYIGIISGTCGKMPGPGCKALTDEWWGLIEHAIREADRLGLHIGLFNSPGWSQSGGPWVKPDQSMRYVVQSEMHLTGPKHFEGKLPPLPGAFDDVAVQDIAVQDIAVLAMPAPKGEDQRAKVAARTAREIRFEMAKPFTARSLTVQPVEKINVAAELQVSDDGKAYRTVKKFKIDRHNLRVNVGPVPLAPVAVSFPAVKGRHFRLKFSGPCKVGEVRLSPAVRVESFAEKSLLKVFQAPLPPFDFYTWPAEPEPKADGLIVKPESVVNISKHVSADGTLRWDVPAGEWIVLRTAMTQTGTKNAPAPPEATGLEVDKMSRPALKAHFDAYVGELLRRMPADQRKAWKHVVADSYEMGPENWTDGFAADFKKRYGYDPLPFLPVMTGRVVGSVDQSDRFLWDLRRMVADRIARDYVGGLRDLCHQHGLQMWLENYGHWGFPSEFLKYGGFCDEIGGEFWVNARADGIELRDAASAAHIYGKPVVWAEAFTGGPAFMNSPRDLKAKGDWAFTKGINQFVLHVYIQQPWSDRRPGINAWFGTEFNRNNTWFPYSKPWFDYLRRCSVMLQAGNNVADVAYFITEDAPKMDGLRQPPLPAGYDYDYINADVIENRLSVKDGRLVLPDGMSYRLLVLPPSETMRPGLLAKIAKLVEAGAAVLGPAPKRSPSMQNYPACDAEVKKLAGRLWGADRVMTDTDLAKALGRLHVPADVVCPDDILWKHRKLGTTDIYFLSNQQNAARTATVSFRAIGRAPQLWRPDSGEIEGAPFAVKDGRTVMTLDFDPAGSVFVVFRDAKPLPVRKLDLQMIGRLDGPWKVRFGAKAVTFDKLASWTDHADPAIKYYSGTAVYRKDFEVHGLKGHTVLDLGTVDDIARVRLNGKQVGTAWKRPYRVDITSAVKQGENKLEIEVVNTWHNRLVGDAQPDVKKPVTFTTKSTVGRKSKLQQAGLLGPVSLLTGDYVEAK